MDNDDWDLSSIVRSYKSITFTNPSPFCETSPQNLSTTTTTNNNNNSIVSPINAAPSSFGDFGDFIFNQENSLVANAYTMDNDWDLSYIVRSCKATTFYESPQNLTTNDIAGITNSRVSPINTTPSCSVDFNSNQENNLVSFTPLKPNDFIDLNKLRVNFNLTAHIPTPTTTSIPTTVTTTTSSVTTGTTNFSINNTPNITNINTSAHVSNQNSTFFYLSTPILQHQMQPNEFTEDSFIPKFNPTTSISTPTTTISTQTITPTHQQQPRRQSRKRKNKNVVTSVCHVKKDKLSEDQWQWRKYGQKPIKGSPHSRSYYKCSSFKNCPAKKRIEKSKTEENTYVVTYRGKHNHQKLEVKQNSDNVTSRNKSSKARLSVFGEAGSSQNFTNLDSSNVEMVWFDQSVSNDAQILDGHSKITNPKIELNESQSHVVGEAGSSENIQKLDSHNMMMLQRGESHVGELEIPYSHTDFIGSYYDDDDILIPNISAMSKDFLLDFNHLNGGTILP